MQKKKTTWRWFFAFVAICLAFVLPLAASGELLRVDDVIALQPYLGENFLYGDSYSGSYSAYKYKMLVKKQASVLVIGDSRSLQFKSDFFRNSDDFYNAGMLFVTPHQGLIALENTPDEALPDTLIYVIDHSGLTSGYGKNQDGDIPEFLQTEMFTTPRELLPRLTSDLSNGTFTLGQVLSGWDKIGMTAKTKGCGFKQDGSYYYGYIYEGTKTAEERVSADLDRIHKGNDWFKGGDKVFDEALTVFGGIADLCTEKGIRLVAILPPFSPAGYQAYHDQRKDTGFLDCIDAQLGPVFESRGAEFYNFTDPASLQLTNEEFIDAFHGSDVTYLRMLKAMVKSGSCLREYVDIEALEAMDAQRVSGLILRKGL